MSRRKSTVGVEFAAFRQRASNKAITQFSLENQDEFVEGSLRIGKRVHDGKRLPFLITSPTANIKDVFKKLTIGWGVAKPRIALFVVSDPMCMVQWTDTRDVRSFIEGLINAMNTTEMWLCTDGLNVGISKEIGDALYMEQNRRKFKENEEVRSVYPETALIGICRQAQLTISTLLDTSSAEPPNADQSEEKREINDSHNYFLLIKDKLGKSGIDDFILNLESYLVERIPYAVRRTVVQYEDAKLKMRIKTPVIAILVNGGVDKIDFVLNHIKMCLPLVIIKGSGGLADLLSYAYDNVNWSIKNLKTNYAEFVEKVLKPRLSQKICQIFPDLEEQNLTRNFLCEKIFNCIRCGSQNEVQFISVLDTTDPHCRLEKLPELLLRALFESQLSDYASHKEQMTKDLHIAMDWNCPDVALAEVFARVSGSMFKIDGDTFLRALTKPDREQFVGIFLNLGFKVHTFLNSNRLLELFHVSVNREFFRAVVWEGAMGITSLVEIHRQFINTKLNMLLQEFTGIPNMINTMDLDSNFKEEYGDVSDVEAEQKAIQILIIWGILSYKVELVKAVWKQSEQPIHLALVCSVILSRLRPYVSDLGLKEEMIKYSKDFSNMATGVLTMSFEEVPCRADEALYEENIVWSFKSLVEIAAYAKNKAFLAHPCCQKWLDTVFMGFIKIRDLPHGDFRFPDWLKIILSVIFVFPMYVWIRFEVPAKTDETMSIPAQILARPRCSQSAAIMRSHRFQPGTKATGHQHSESRNFKQLRIWEKIYYLWTAPITKFWVLQLSSFIYIALLSVAALWPSCGNQLIDFILCMWTSVIAMDVIYSAYSLYKKYPSIPLFYKCLEILLMVLFTALYTLGRVFPRNMFLTPYQAKLVICLGLLFFFYRIIFLSLPISPQMGPLLYRVKRMTVVDFKNFMCVTVLVMISNGIVLQVIVFPDYPLSKELFFNVFHTAWSYFFLSPLEEFGEPDLKCIPLKKYKDKNYYMGFEQDKCKAGKYYGNECRNPGFWPYIFGVQYLMLLRMILLTLLYALFSNTQNKLREEGDYIWKYQRYQLVVDFADRVSLPAPFSIISYLTIFFKTLFDALWTCKLPTIQQGKKKKSDVQDRYWKQLAQSYSDREELEKSKGKATKNRMQSLAALTDNLNSQRLVVRDVLSRLATLHYEIQHTHQYLQTDKKGFTAKEWLRCKIAPQMFSRQSPYPNTKIPRTPVTDKHVPWEKVWLDYHPVSYTQSEHLYPKRLKEYLDICVQTMQETEKEHFKMPVFRWNEAATSPGGVYLDRTSWTKDDEKGLGGYVIDPEGLPRNPMGRTGMRGRGCLPRWGPNHYVYIIITQSRETIIGVKTQFLQVVLQKSGKSFHLPGSFVGSEDRYEVVRQLFRCDSKWDSDEDIMRFFKSSLPSARREENEGESSKDKDESSKDEGESSKDKDESGTDEERAKSAVAFRSKMSLLNLNESFSQEDVIHSLPSLHATPRSKTMKVEGMEYSLIHMGYMDDSVNTDQAWCEAEVWHLHFVGENRLDELFGEELYWHFVSDELLEDLNIGQAAFLHTVIKRCKG